MKDLTINLDKIIIQPITSQQEFEDANKIIDALVDADLIEDIETRKRALDILEAVTTLAIGYEKKHFPIQKLDPIESIKQRMEMLNLSQKDLAKLLGGENRVSEVLNRKRPLTLKMIKNLYQNFGIPAETLLAY
jgi:HTH-type transcriptional regulator / antitoxin HigA